VESIQVISLKIYIFFCNLCVDLCFDSAECEFCQSSDWCSWKQSWQTSWYLKSCFIIYTTQASKYVYVAILMQREPSWENKDVVVKEIQILMNKYRF